MEPKSRPPFTPRPLAIATGLILALAACGGSSRTSGQSDPNEAGQTIIDPATGRYFLVDGNESGESQTPRILRVAWGRLVRVLGLGTSDPNGPRVEMQRNFLIAPNLVSGQGYVLERNAVTGEETLTILENVDEAAGLEAFFDKLRLAEQNLAPIFDTGQGGNGLFTMVPRNAAIMVQFDDLIDASTLDATTVRLQVGVPPLLPFESRVLIDSNHGDLADYDGDEADEFYSTRVILDPAISQLEAFESDPPQPVNGLGLPPSLDVLTSNVEIRIPTQTVQGIQDAVLMNPSEHALTATDNGTVDFTSPSRDLVRAVRSGGPSGQTADPFNGFLPDQAPPRITGSQLVEIAGNPIYSGGAEFTIPLVRFQSIFCSQTPIIGDVIAQTQIGVFAEVTAQPLPVSEGDVINVPVRLLVWPNAWGNAPEEWASAAPGSAQFLSAYDPDAGDLAACFVQISPQPVGYPENPTMDMFTSSNFSVRFSEPMDPRSLTAFDAIQVLRQATPEVSDHYVPGTIQLSQDLQSATFLPELPLAHAAGQSESYYVEVTNGALGATDLAGNQVAQVFSEQRPGGSFANVAMDVLSTSAPQATGGRVSRFTGPDEDPPFAGPGEDPLAEFGGQHTYDFSSQALRPRPVTRMQSVVDRSQPMISAMTTSLTGQQSPVSNFGSKTQMLWRYVDAGFSLTDPIDFNLDIEGLNWAPYGGFAPVVDSYDSFEIALSHAGFLPDEIIDPITQLPVYPDSGLDAIYANNFLNGNEDPQRTVHPRALGYEINPGDTFTVGSNVLMIPFPLNRTIPQEQFRYYTWRDTALQTRGGANGYGGPPAQFFSVYGIPFPITGDCMLMPTPNPFYNPTEIQSVGLPLLMEFRCYADDGANGINRFETSLAVAASNRPYFRAFSEGGIDTSQNIVLVDPDLESEANGGYNPSSVPVPGAPTQGRDGNVYIGAMDLVVRISRSFSIWQQTTNPLGAPAFLSPDYYPPTVEPRAEDQPPGTAIELAFRGATLVDPPTSEVRTDAQELDAYGDHYTEDPSLCDGSITHNNDTLNLDISFLNNDMRWFEGIDAIDGAQYYQVRVTFTSNTVSGENALLKGLGVSWTD